jgi:hypothetical protein
MAVEQSITITCDRCEREHYEGSARDRPEHINVTWWGGSLRPDWDLESLCGPCMREFIAALNAWPKTGALEVPGEGGDDEETGFLSEYVPDPDNDPEYAPESYADGTSLGAQTVREQLRAESHPECEKHGD